ncbi:MAG: outer membrane beta-barrel protein [Bacteroidetes bacterium]|nr:outer membrane beta-barrel protein [Bacteroidota bacterium]
MKKILFIFLAFTFGSKYAFTQDSGENDLKNFRFGLKAAGMLTWYKPDDVKKYTSGGVSARGGYGLITDFRLNKVACFETGLQVDYDRGKLNFLTEKDTNFYYLDKDGALIAKSDSAAGTIKYRVNMRDYHTTYLTIPITLKLKTPEIGSITYFGQFGLNASFRLKSRTTDDVNSVSGLVIGGHSTQTDLLNTKDMNMFRLQLNIGGGAEWSLAGSTSMVFGLNWYNGFSNVLKLDSEYLFRTPSNGGVASKQNAKSSCIALTIGVLF